MKFLFSLTLRLRYLQWAQVTSHPGAQPPLARTAPDSRYSSIYAGTSDRNLDKSQILSWSPLLQRPSRGWEHTMWGGLHCFHGPDGDGSTHVQGYITSLLMVRSIWFFLRYTSTTLGVTMKALHLHRGGTIPPPLEGVRGWPKVWKLAQRKLPHRRREYRCCYVQQW